MDELDDSLNVTCECDLSFVETQLVDLNDNIVILTDKIYGLNSIVLLILTLMVISCIYKLLKFIF